MKTKLRKIGSGYGVLLPPKRVIDHLRLSVGDELELTESKAGVELSPFDPDFADHVEAFRRTEGSTASDAGRRLGSVDGEERREENSPSGQMNPG